MRQEDGREMVKVVKERKKISKLFFPDFENWPT